MQPKNELHRRVVALSSQLRPLTDEQKDWMRHHVFRKVGTRTRGHVVCHICGERFKTNLKNYTCPHCGHRLKLFSTKDMVRVHRWYVTLPDTIGEFQVIRHFIAKQTVYLTKPIKYEYDEVVQIWLTEDYKRVVMARPIFPCTYDHWSVDKPLELRTYHDKHDVNSWIMPGGKIAKWVRKRGCNLKLMRKYFSSPDFLVLYSTKFPFVEYLIKTHQMDMLKYVLKKYNPDYKYSNAVRICHKHGYYIKDASMWHDYVELLDYFHLDIHSPHYLCPVDLEEEHDKLLRRKMRKEAEERLKEEIKKAVKYEDEYRKRYGKYFGLCFNNGHIYISVLDSVMEVAKEGAYMHHCVFSMGYYKRPDTLLLSARGENGIRLETIELNLKSMEIVQSRGLQNKSTKYHDEILGLMKNNMALISALKRKRKRPKI